MAAQGSPDSLSLSDILGCKPTTNNSDPSEDSMSSSDDMDGSMVPDFDKSRDDALAILAKVNQRGQGKPDIIVVPPRITNTQHANELETQQLTNQVRKIQQTSSLIPQPSSSSVRTQSGLKALLHESNRMCVICVRCVLFCFVHTLTINSFNFINIATYICTSGKEVAADQTKHLVDMYTKGAEGIKNHVSQDGGKTRDAIQVLQSAQQDSARKIRDMHDLLMSRDVVLTSSRKRSNIPNTVECATTTTAESTASMIDSESSLAGVSRNLYGSNNERLRTPATQKRKKKMGIMSSQKKRKAVSLTQRQEDAILDHNRRMNHPLRSEINFD